MHLKSRGQKCPAAIRTSFHLLLVEVLIDISLILLQKFLNDSIGRFHICSDWRINLTTTRQISLHVDALVSVVKVTDKGIAHGCLQEINLTHIGIHTKRGFLIRGVILVVKYVGTRSMGLRLSTLLISHQSFDESLWFSRTRQPFLRLKFFLLLVKSFLTPIYMSLYLFHVKFLLAYIADYGPLFLAFSSTFIPATLVFKRTSHILPHAI